MKYHFMTNKYLNGVNRVSKEQLVVQNNEMIERNVKKLILQEDPVIF